MRRLKRVVIKEELVALTGDFTEAVILNQFIYWSERIADFDKFILEEKERAKINEEDINIQPRNGWIYKKISELKDEIMSPESEKTIRRKVQNLVEKGYLDERTNPLYKWDKTLQYRVNMVKIAKDLYKIGYFLQDYKYDISELIDKQNDMTDKQNNISSGQSSPNEQNVPPNGQNDDSNGQNLSNEENVASKSQNDDSVGHVASESQNDAAIPEITTEITLPSNSISLKDANNTPKNKNKHISPPTHPLYIYNNACARVRTESNIDENTALSSDTQNIPITGGESAVSNDAENISNASIPHLQSPFLSKPLSQDTELHTRDCTSFRESNARTASSPAHVLGENDSQLIDSIGTEPDPKQGEGPVWYNSSAEASGPVKVQMPPILGAILGNTALAADDAADVQVLQEASEDGEKDGKQPSKKRNSEKRQLADAQERIFEAWNAEKIIVHKVLNERMKRAASSALKVYTEQEIITAIRNYAKILHSNDYFLTYKWTLDEFLKRSIEKFLNWEICSANYIDRRKQYERKRDSVKGGASPNADAGGRTDSRQEEQFVEWIPAAWLEVEEKIKQEKEARRNAGLA
ncbi:hypothetical protein SAMN02746089_02573 [Caldanaerobius fijiensis DSM 17918]|uniref:Uncharacterized protein n=1 Tax=Caldanaerobius fijiensis DSM 17918 TaxID=1121256 RepID=A0A1M5ELL5_9THEO|nr:hypothetical protein [Caldanaerobius fijiensis]SHF80034.1 hypothetical protein SAMN02746089_02573 [Caldanaerobius fijiensis DSM 17918]